MNRRDHFIVTLSVLHECVKTHTHPEKYLRHFVASGDALMPRDCFVACRHTSYLVSNV